ncbi:MAG: mechanosensitive ion channel family protein [Archaeoglobaceae archaeon]|nr:mechanosensitive ion channel family protein [Archaeoglobales archaeon]MDI9641892.1 mechanosensitive ion channel family protein [Archaeoglobales archaeon]
MATLDIYSFQLLVTLVSALGVSFVLKDYVASAIAGLIFRKVKHIRPNTRIKVMVNPVIKGDVVDIGWFRTTLKEVGDGERLPSVHTGRILKLPNFFLFNNPLVIYGETITDEVVAYIEAKRFNPSCIELMRKAIEEEGHKVVEVGVFQKENYFIVHGIFESDISEMTDVRSKILLNFFKKVEEASKKAGS